MSDKSFGDYTNRNVVKNPLLSSAVTGLSIEDLTHNAVLLPAVPTQEPFLRQDQQHETQMQTLRYSDQENSNIPSGDAKNITTYYNSPLNLNPNPQNTQKYDLTFNTHDISTPSLSKATPKSDDDFDVNEYFARLQGTRYVSAPLNSNIKEDQNANLQVEENLEEINLNEPDKAQNTDDVQHSLTADIAQNFSQLPTVLPQVASVVFSSFSNMLNYKSREQTPDEGKIYQDTAAAPKFDMNVPLVPVAPEVPKEVAPPPLKEPPSGVASNYRITTKKKVYAQIPGLSSTDNQHVRTFNAPSSSHAPQNFFTPESNVNALLVENKSENLDIGPLPHTSAAEVKMESHTINYQKTEQLSSTHIFNPIPFEEKSHPLEIQSGLFVPSQSTEVIIPKQEQELTLDTTNKSLITSPPGSTAIIPPPPMFSNIQRDNQTSVKSFLPPSVARRIAGAHPVIKPQTAPTIIPQQNIFVPTMPDPSTVSSFGINMIEQQTFSQPPSQYSEPTSLHDIPVVGKEEPISQNSNNQSYVCAGSLTSSNISQISNLPSNTATLFETSTNIPKADTREGSKSGQYTESLFLSHQATPIETSHFQNVSKPAGNESIMKIETSSIYKQSTLSSEDLNTQTVNQPTTIAPPLFFNPNNYTQADVYTIRKHENPIAIPESQKSQNLPTNSPLEPPKPLPEPPKVTGNQNYRMSKKRPQYYSGPIEGVGSISNNVKPLMNPIGATFQGALFTPDQYVPTATNTLQSSLGQEVAPFDISTPINISYPMYTQQQLPDHNTNFDLSRATTGKYEETQQEFKGFGIIGSLKSKLSSIDINKIQNKVTNFFDPAYNNTKVDNSVIQDNSLYSQNMLGGTYPNYPQNDGATLEVFVPNVNQEQSFGGAYNQPMGYIQPVDQNQQYYQYNQDFFGQNQNLNNQNTNYYPGWHDNYKQQQSSSSYYQNPISVIQNVKLDNNNTSKIAESYKNENLSLKRLDHGDFNNSADSLEKNNEDVKSEVPELVANVQICDQQNLLTKHGNENKIEQQITKQDTNHSDTNTTTELKSFFDYSTQNILPGFNNKKIEEDSTKQNIKVLQDTQSLQSTKPIQPISSNNPLSVLNATIESDLGLVTNVQSQNFFSDLPKLSQDHSSKGFFDKETPIVLPFEAKKLEENINKRKLREEAEISKLITQSKSMPFLKPTVVKGCSNEYIDYQNRNLKNIIDVHSKSNFTQNTDDLSTIKIPDLKDMAEGILPPLKKDDQVKEYTMFGPENQATKDPQDMANTFFLFEPSSNISSIPVFNLSSMSAVTLPSSNKPKDVKDIETKMENVSLFESTDTTDLTHNATSVLGSIASTDLQNELLDDPISELNICETCREVNKPEEKEIEDLTTQLIENITAPIQLENPVEYPVIEDSVINKNDYDSSFSMPQTEDIIESMKLPPPIDLINEISSNTSILNYGWSTNEAHSSKVLPDHDYGFQIDQSAIAFVQDRSLFFENIPANASDEIKAGYKNPEEDPTILPRQMSIPTAPPEEDTKSDESGLDVHSIEQDAKMDFPIYEDLIVEPSETDDDKIEYKERERSSDDLEQTIDTFTDRVERYKKMETATDLNDISFKIQKEQFNTFDIPTSTSPAITIASYFDTGNYAVENHYRNSLTSPSTLSSFNTTMRIPPGFEEEYQRRFSGISSQDIMPNLSSQNISSIFEVNKTQIPTNLVTAQPYLEESLCDDNVETMIKELIEDTSTEIEDIPTFTSLSFTDTKNETVEEKKEKTVSVFENEPTNKGEPKLESLPDPINFFSSNEDSAQESDAFSNFSRLSSYFTTPPKPDHSKSFFELSQSQNHYRHKPSENKSDPIENNVRYFFENANFNSNINEQHKNIPQSISQNMSLVNNLISIENFIPNQNVVTTTNYFTVDFINKTIHGIKISEADINKLKKHLHEPLINKTDDDKNNNNTRDIDETSLSNIVTSCNYCCDRTKIHNSNFKFRKSMDSNTESKGNSNMETKKEGTKKSLAVNFCEQTFQEDADNKIVIISENRGTSEYASVKHHWFYKVDSEEKSLWRGFSVIDSRALENAYTSPDLNENTLVATDGGRFDVNIMARLKIAVYWTDKPANVMRCSWFYKGTTDARYVPYTEDIAEKLEEEYRHGITTGEWHRRLMLENNELVVMHGPAVMVHFLQSPVNDTFGTSPFFGKKVYRNPPKIRVCEDQPKRIDHLIFMVHGAGEYSHQKAKIQAMMRPRVVRRGCIESEIEDAEPSSIDHLLLLCHGVGSACDMRFRPVEEVVDDFRATSLQLIQSHYKNSFDSGLVGRVEVLPISWHSSLHSGTGVDKRLAAVTLESIPRLRNFTNDTILDVLFYTSPVFCQTIIDTVCSELNRIYKLFKSRNPDFNGGVSLGGHSLGSVILYDLLCHQLPMNSSENQLNMKHLMKGTAGTGQPCVEYPKLGFSPDALYALGSPIAIFECIRGIESLGEDFCLPTCRNFFNIFHPYDPIAYRIEPMISPQMRDVKPYLIPHHKGRKRMHLELKDTMARVGADIKQKLIESIKNTWSSMWKTQPPPDQHLEKVVEEEMEKEELTAENKEEHIENKEVTAEMLGKLNDGRRIDYVLQEAPFEMINEYLFAMSSHVCYWESEDTMLVMLREIYNALGVAPDCSLPQNTMTVQRHRSQDDTSITSPESPSTSRGGF